MKKTYLFIGLYFALTSLYAQIYDQKNSNNTRLNKSEFTDSLCHNRCIDCLKVIQKNSSVGIYFSIDTNIYFSPDDLKLRFVDDSKSEIWMKAEICGNYLASILWYERVYFADVFILKFESTRLAEEAFFSFNLNKNTMTSSDVEGLAYWDWLLIRNHIIVFQSDQEESSNPVWCLKFFNIAKNQFLVNCNY